MKNTITAEQLREIADRYGLDYENGVRVNYSGRGMYGDTCIGFVHDGSAFGLGAVMHKILGDEVFYLSPSQDGMGLSSITYFRDLKLADGEEWDEDE